MLTDTETTTTTVLATAYGDLEIWPITAVPGAERLPFAHRIILENLLRHQDGEVVTQRDIDALVAGGAGTHDIAFHPSRVFLHDTNGVPVLTDLAAMRDAFAAKGMDPALLDTEVPAQLTVDHSVVTDFFGRPDAPALNVRREYERNAERYRFIKWGREAFSGLEVVPPGAGIMHQVNVEYLADVVTVRDGRAFPDTVAGTDSHTTMVNGLSVLAWGVGGIEAEAAMLGEPVTMLIPPVVGVELVGRLRPGVTATDLVLTLTERMRALGVVGSIVEFHGPGVTEVSLATRCTIANMSPEFGSTSAIFPIDDATIEFLLMTGRSERQASLVETYARAQGLWSDPGCPADYDRRVVVDLDGITPSLAGPRRPQDRIELADAPAAAQRALAEAHLIAPLASSEQDRAVPDGAVAIASITSCTNTSNPAVMMAAGLLARNARARGLQSKSWVKTSLAPGSRVVTDYLAKAGLMSPLEELGFGLVGFGCMTCIGNSGDLLPEVLGGIEQDGIVVASVLSGNRNFDGRINNDVGMNFLTSPPLVVAYALVGTMHVDLTRDPLGHDEAGAPVYLADLWPSDQEIQQAVSSSIDPEMYTDAYSSIFDGDENWQGLDAPGGDGFDWDQDSTYLQRPPFLELDAAAGSTDIEGARVLMFLEDSVTTDHICPAGRIPAASAAGRHLTELGVGARDLSSYASRRGNWRVMKLGGFTNTRLVNRLVSAGNGGSTRDFLAGEPAATAPIREIHAVADAAADAGIPLIVLAGREYGTGSSRDWAAKVTRLLGVRAVIAQSFERIHRSNLVGMGVLPLQFEEGTNADTLGLDGSERFSIRGLAADADVPDHLEVVAVHPDTGSVTSFVVRARVDTSLEQRYLRSGGVLPYALERAASRHTQKPDITEKGGTTVLATPTG
ncbi:aconitate hydratase AcnA [Pseudoclavibacter terrae]|uniref:aconitate hydratase AcnA n=1 Tax=Pseudoclavibacter terrae TaxID=1530195 RepID=UPI00232F8A8E|nr:aconitate hydratase AcnA [Pseudoclavibacter terrae]